MRLLQLLAAVLISLSFVGAPAYAKKDKDDTEYIKIEKTGLPEIDKVFTEVKKIQKTLGAVETSIDTTTSSLNTSLGLAADTPFTTAIEDLKSKAEGAIQVTLDGGSPKLTTADAVPSNVQAGIDAVNTGVAEVNSAIAGLKELPGQMSELQKQATSIDPSTIKDQATSAGLGFTEALEAAKILGSNLKATGQTVDRATAVKDASVDFMGAFTGTFGEASGGDGGGNAASGGDRGTRGDSGGDSDGDGGGDRGGDRGNGGNAGNGNQGGDAGKDAGKDAGSQGGGGRTRGNTGPRR